MSTLKKQRAPIQGYLMLMALIFGAIFVTLFGALAGFVLSQNKTQTQVAHAEQAFSLAESGIEYYRWFLSHFPGDVTNGTGSSGPYSFTQKDIEGTAVGTVSFTLTPTTSCGETTGVAITSTGVSGGTPNVSVSISARLAQPTVAAYSQITNDSAWIAAGQTLSGAFHSNGGVRMDGDTNAKVESSVTSWNCTSFYGCTPAVSSAPGVLGTGSNQTLWESPVPQVDFAGIAAQFGTLKESAETSGIYYPRLSSGNATSSASYWHGYHLIFNDDGTIVVRQVTATQPLSVTPLNTLDGATDHSLIQSETTLETQTLSGNCGLIFVEDNVWIEGTIPRKVTLVAGNVASGGVIQPNIYIKDTVQYAKTDGTSGLTVIAANDVLIGADAPPEMILNGIFVAANGSFGRNLYINGGTCNWSYESLSSLNFSGTIVSNKRTKIKWNAGCGARDGGYPIRADAYDPHQVNNPPAFTPITSTDYQIFDWYQH